MSPYAKMYQINFTIFPTGGLSIVDRIKNSLSPGPATSKDSSSHEKVWKSWKQSKVWTHWDIQLVDYIGEP